MLGESVDDDVVFLVVVCDCFIFATQSVLSVPLRVPQSFVCTVVEELDTDVLESELAGVCAIVAPARKQPAAKA